MTFLTPPPKKKKIPFRATGEKMWRSHTSPKVAILRRYIVYIIHPEVFLKPFFAIWAIFCHLGHFWPFQLSKSIYKLLQTTAKYILKYDEGNLRVNSSWGRIWLSGGVFMILTSFQYVGILNIFWEIYEQYFNTYNFWISIGTIFQYILPCVLLDILGNDPFYSPLSPQSISSR